MRLQRARTLTEIGAPSPTGKKCSDLHSQWIHLTWTEASGRDDIARFWILDPEIEDLDLPCTRFGLALLGGRGCR